MIETGWSAFLAGAPHSRLHLAIYRYVSVIEGFLVGVPSFNVGVDVVPGDEGDLSRWRN